jgi:uncharacterized protein HemX
MANSTPSVKSNKISKSFVAAAVGWGLIAAIIFAGAGFYAGYQYKATQDAKTKAAVQDAIKAIQAPQVAEASPKK